MTTIMINRFDLDALLDVLAYAIDQVHDSYVPVISAIETEPMENYTEEQAESALFTLQTLHESFSTIKADGRGISIVVVDTFE